MARTTVKAAHRIVIIAIDGPAGSGKSTTARAVASRLGFLYLDTGAMYRAVALEFIRRGAAVSETEADRVLENVRLDLEATADGIVVRLGGEDVTAKLRTPDVTRMSSRVSALPPVRRFLVSEQRRIVKVSTVSGVVVEGRDIGTVVFPRAEVKVFLTASADVRARRRADELRQEGGADDEDQVRSEMEERDRSDASRAASPLRPAADAEIIDTTSLTFGEQVERIVELARERG